MEYSVNPAVLTNMFAVPSTVVDQHIKLAGGVHLKVLLWVLRNAAAADVSIKAIADILKLPEADIIDALEYWVDAGVLKKEGAEPVKAEPVKKIIKPVMPDKPSREEVIKRGVESPEISFMLNEVQMKLARLVSNSEMATLVWLHDYQGLPVPVILMSVEYAISENKINFRFIEKVCIDWASNDIHTIEKAEERLKDIYLAKTAWKIVESAFGIAHRKPSANEEKYSVMWVNEWGYTKNMLVLAYNQCIDSIQKISFPYINKIIKEWHKNGIHSLKDAEKATSERKEKTENKPAATASYNIRDIKDKFREIDKD